jgi:hypothetical protein
MTNVGMFLGLAVLAIVVCVFFAMFTVIIGFFQIVGTWMGKMLGMNPPQRPGSPRSAESSPGRSDGLRSCPRKGCGYSNVSEARFCAQCGARLS